MIFACSLIDTIALSFGNWEFPRIQVGIIKYHFQEGSDLAIQTAAIPVYHSLS